MLGVEVIAGVQPDNTPMRLLSRASLNTIRTSGRLVFSVPYLHPSVQSLKVQPTFSGCSERT